MRTTVDLIRAGYLLRESVSLPRGGPWQCERALVSHDDEAVPRDCYLRSDCVDLDRAQQLLSSSALLGSSAGRSGQVGAPTCSVRGPIREESVASARAALQRGEEALLTSEDYLEPPQVHTFVQEEGPIKYMGAFGVPYRTTVYRTTDSQCLDDFVRDMTRVPGATWAIAATDHGCVAPRLLVFVPLTDAVALDPHGGHGLVFDRPSGARAGDASGTGAVRLEEDSVYLGAVRVDRRRADGDASQA